MKIQFSTLHSKNASANSSNKLFKIPSLVEKHLHSSKSSHKDALFRKYICNNSKMLYKQKGQGIYLVLFATKTCVRGFEPPTPWSVAKCSIQLSYTHILFVAHTTYFIIHFFLQMSRKKWTAADRNRTGTMSPPQDFKSCASASSATAACYEHLDDNKWNEVGILCAMHTWPLVRTNVSDVRT